MNKFLDNWKKTAVKVADFQMRLILSLFYFLLILPYYLGFRISRWFQRKPENITTAFRDIPRMPRPLEGLRRQY